jgi:hypothetical protein
MLKAAIPDVGSATLYPDTDILVSWWKNDFMDRMTGAVGNWSHHYGGSGDGATRHHDSGHSDHGGFDGGHHSGHHGGDSGSSWKPCQRHHQSASDVRF